MLLSAFKLSRIIQNNQQIKLIHGEVLLSQSCFKWLTVHSTVPGQIQVRNQIYRHSTELISQELCLTVWRARPKPPTFAQEHGWSSQRMFSMASRSWHAEQQSHHSLGNTLTNHLSPFLAQQWYSRKHSLCSRGAISVHRWVAQGYTSFWKAIMQQNTWLLLKRGHGSSGWKADKVQDNWVWKFLITVPFTNFRQLGCGMWYVEIHTCGQRPGQADLTCTLRHIPHG